MREFQESSGLPPFPPSDAEPRLLPPGFGGIVKWGLVALVLLFLFIALSVGRGIYTDWLWFRAVEFQDVYLTILTTRIWLFAAGALVFALLLGGSLALAYRYSAGETLTPLPPETVVWIRRLTIGGAALATFLLSLIFGAIAAGQWETVLRYLNSVPFGLEDPQFHRDISFYVFTMPLLTLIQGWFLGAFIVTLLATAVLYFLRFNLRGVVFSLTPRMQWHLSVLGALILLDVAFSYWLDIYQLVYSAGGAVFGATYTDVHAKIPALRILIAIAVAAAVLLAVSNFFARALWLMGGVVGLWIGSAIIVGAIYPGLVQRFHVQPSELERETPYIKRNIEATREAFGLDRIEVEPFAAAGNLDLETIQAHPGTVSNIRLWDHRPLQSIYNQIQFFRTYYDFLDVDVDRYELNGETRQVLISARELSPEKLDPEAQTWVNQRLKFTHGYGAAMSPVTAFTEEGEPEFFLQDLPPKGDLSLTRPEVYYGEKSRDFVIVNTKESEFDYPLGDEPVYTSYQGKGGVPLNSFIDKLAYAWQFADINILISGQITSDSRLQYRRDIQDRVSTVAPFLRLDADAYVVVADGALWWIQDAYTTTRLYPYSRPLDGQFNYVRNSVKVVMNAFDGTLQFYVLDPEDPLIQTYQRIFPELFLPFEEMPDSLQPHIRYPIDLFTWQAETYLQYHMEDEAVFYNKEDQWSTPNEVFFETTTPMEPYYVTMKLPGEEEEEFVLILPFTPFERKNMVGWFAARNDGDNYGKLLVFTFPRVSQVDGPEQIEARINNDEAIAAQFGLWRRSQTDVLRGNLLVIPIEDSLLYAEPVYLQAQNLEFPELKRVILADATRVTMQPSLDEAITALFGAAPIGGEQSLATDGGGEVVLSEVLLSQLQQGLQEMSDAITNLQEGLTTLEDVLSQLADELEGTSP